MADRIDGTLKKARALRGAEEFANYLDNVRTLFDRMTVKNITALYTRAALFSINDGDGLRTQVRLLSELWAGLLELERLPVTYYELKLPDRMDAKDVNRMTDRDIVLGNLDEDGVLRPGGRRLLCVDVTKWIDRMERSDFRAAMNRFRGTREDQTLVFRIPAVDAATLRRVEETLNWFLNVDVVYTPPVSVEDYYAYGLERLKERDVTPVPRVQEILMQELVRRRNDNRFWGFHTVDSLTDTMIWLTMRSQFGREFKEL